MRSLLDRETVSIDTFEDVDTTTTPPADTNVLQFNSATGKWLPGTGGVAGSGEANTITSINTGGGQTIYDSKIGVDFKFRGLNTASSKLTIAYNATTAEIEYDFGTVNLDDLSQIDLTTVAPTTGDHLSWDGSNWVPEAPPVLTPTSIDDLTDVDTSTTSPTLGDTLVFDGSNWVTNLTQLTRNVDEVSDVYYIGEAAPGSNTASSVWRIKKITFNGDDSVTEWADGNSNFDNTWDNRLSLSYT